MGAKQLVVQEALDTTLWLALSYSVWFTPHTLVPTQTNFFGSKTYSNKVVATMLTREYQGECGHTLHESVSLSLCVGVGGLHY